MTIPLTIPQAEQVLTRAAGRTVRIYEDFHGYYARLAFGDYLPLYDRALAVDHTTVTVVYPAEGDWPDCDDLTDCPEPWMQPGADDPSDEDLRRHEAENAAADAAQLWNERRGA